MDSIDIAHALDVAKRAAQAGSTASLEHFDQGIQVERKADRSPVTAADRAAEQAILSTIVAAFPQHSVLAEESGIHDGDPRYRWIIDPIDGTLGFTRGGKFWGSLIALEADGEVVVGTLALPALGQTYAAGRGEGCYLNDGRITLAAEPTLDRATLSLGEMRALMRAPWGPAVRGLMNDAESARCYGDLMAIALVLQGVADLWLEAGVSPWDLAPARVLFEEAGGVFSTFQGDTDLTSGTGIGARPGLHGLALARIKGTG